MAIDWSTEWQQIVAICAQRGLDPCLVAAVRVAENGADGTQYGVLSAPAPTYADQLRVCTRTLAGYLLQYDGNPFMLIDVNGLKRLCYTPNFLAYCRNHYAPIGVDNDPNGKNANWLGNVSAKYKEFVQAGGPT